MTDKIMVTNNQLIISSFKPKNVEMHWREHLASFRSAAESTGVRLNWPSWRFSIELGSKLYNVLREQGGISDEDHNKIETGSIIGWSSFYYQSS